MHKEQERAIDDMVREIHDWAVSKGWASRVRHPEALHVDEVGMKIALMHSELTEALEVVRNVDPTDPAYMGIVYTGGDDKPDGLAVELADAMIRIMQLAGQLDLPLGRAMREKLAYNETRGIRHGGKRA